jgi:hypothetical protein
MILSHKHAPEHCFGDILDRVPPEQLRELKDIETKALEAARQVNHDAKEAGKEVQDVGLQTAKSDLGKEYHAGARGCQPDQCKIDSIKSQETSQNNIVVELSTF